MAKHRFDGYSTPAAMPMPEPVSECDDEGREPESRYTHMTNPDLARRRPLLQPEDSSPSVKPADIREGCSFIQPMTGQCENDQFPWGKFND